MVGCQWDVANERDESLKQTLLQIQSNLSTKATLGTEENGRVRDVTVIVGWGVTEKYIASKNNTERKFQAKWEVYVNNRSKV